MTGEPNEDGPVHAAEETTRLQELDWRGVDHDHGSGPLGAPSPTQRVAHMRYVITPSKSALAGRKIG